MFGRLVAILRSCFSRGNHLRLPDDAESRLFRNIDNHIIAAALIFIEAMDDYSVGYELNVYINNYDHDGPNVLIGFDGYECERFITYLGYCHADLGINSIKFLFFDSDVKLFMRFKNGCYSLCNKLEKTLREKTGRWPWDPCGNNGYLISSADYSDPKFHDTIIKSADYILGIIECEYDKKMEDAQVPF